MDEKEMEQNRNEIEAHLKASGREGMDKLIEYLRATGFYTAPASSKYHNSFPGGLAAHSLLVHKNLSELNERLMLGLTPGEVAITALLHDVCKANIYKFERYKTKEGGTYKVEDEFPCGHGEKSVIILLRHILLNENEIIMIRWHMGGDDAGGFYSKLAYNEARDKYPELTAMMCADLMASFIQEERKG